MPAREFYDRQYYESHYGRLLGSDSYERLLGLFWREAIFAAHGLDPELAVLDYGCGLGQVSGGLPNATHYDVSSFALDRLERRGRRVVQESRAIPGSSFDAILSSHSLEHVPEPAALLTRFRELVRPGGKLILVLPIESRLGPALAVDNDRHLYAWTFQTITNLLAECGWQAERQATLHSPFMLATLGRLVHERIAVRWALRLGRWKRNYPAMLTIASSR